MPTNLIEVLEEAKKREYRDADGNLVSFTLKPGLTAIEIDQLANELGVSIPPEIQELLLFSRGFEHIQEVDLSGVCDGTDAGDFFTSYLSISEDGFGNHWVIDLTAGVWGPIYYVCHDPPVVVYQSTNLDEFFRACIQMGITPEQNPIDQVSDPLAFEVWSKNPGLIPQPECETSNDPEISAFAQELDAMWFIRDLRNPKPGDGFSWGKFGPETLVKRHGKLPIFAIRKPEPKPGFFARLLGKK